MFNFDQIALEIIATTLAQEIGLLVGLDTLGHDLEIETVREYDDGLDEPVRVTIRQSRAEGSFGVGRPERRRRSAGMTRRPRSLSNGPRSSTRTQRRSPRAEATP